MRKRKDSHDGSPVADTNLLFVPSSSDDSAENGVDALMGMIDEAGAPLGVPRWGLWEPGQALVTLGRPPAQPSGEVLGAESLKEADLIVIPALAASADGTRLGQGGGWYDRALTHRSPGTPVVAVIFDDEVLEAEIIPAEPHDVPVDGIVTPTRTMAINLR